MFIRGSPSYFHVPHAFHELLFGEADFPGISFLLKVRQVVGAINVDGIELKVARSVRKKSFIKSVDATPFIFSNVDLTPFIFYEKCGLEALTYRDL